MFESVELRPTNSSAKEKLRVRVVMMRSTRISTHSTMPGAQSRLWLCHDVTNDGRLQDQLALGLSLLRWSTLFQQLVLRFSAGFADVSLSETMQRAETSRLLYKGGLHWTPEF